MDGVQFFLRPDGVGELILRAKNPGNRFDADVLAQSKRNSRAIGALVRELVRVL